MGVKVVRKFSTSRGLVRISAVIYKEHYEIILAVKRGLEEELGTKISESFALRHILTEFAREKGLL
ncbi:hypothetical protein [Pyrococcus kukulkanii]|uniref:Uncharacterized protein n=1 Tax=Pyrococcus kukulkanii TaxID=1609559 RepID=A0ABV4T8J1_9EURY